MREYLKFYIDGQWVDPVELWTLDVDNPTLEQVGGNIAIGSEADVDKAVKAARKAFAAWSHPREERLDVLQATGRVPGAQATWPKPCTRRWARRRRWRQTPRSMMGWVTWPPPSRS